MKTLFVMLLGLFLFSSCAHQKNKQEVKKECSGEQCKMDKKKAKHPCLDGQCPLKKG